MLAMKAASDAGLNAAVESLNGDGASPDQVASTVTASFNLNWRVRARGSVRVIELALSYALSMI